MITLEEFYINAWRRKEGYPELNLMPKSNLNLKELEITQWNKKFEQLMKNRLIMGAMRYGDNKLSTPGGKKEEIDYKYITYLEYKLKKYKETGNLEFLVDVANLSMLEFHNGNHPKKHWTPIDNEKHCEKNYQKNKVKPKPETSFREIGRCVWLLKDKIIGWKITSGPISNEFNYNSNNYRGFKKYEEFVKSNIIVPTRLYKIKFEKSHDWFKQWEIHEDFKGWNPY